MMSRTMNQKLKLGTRRSLLALAQSGQVAREIERLNPGVEVELVGIDTRGDKILDVSLREITGKEFFVAELDEALIGGRVDLSVHSMKDLSLDRPPELTLAATPGRANPRDVILFGPNVREKIARGKALKIGTSSPRRLENIPPFLRRALPTVKGKDAVVELVEIRGNVNTRLSRVHEPESSERALDGVVLAFAGLIRLWADGPGQEELKKLLRAVRWMVLPLRECPAAPAQGALAIECRADDEKTRQIIGRLHDPASAFAVTRERALLAEWGGGCHQKFGATCVVLDHAAEPLLWVRGRKPPQAGGRAGEYIGDPAGEFVEELRWQPPAVAPRGKGWDGALWRKEGVGESALRPSTGTSPTISADSGIFVAHSRALPADWERELPALAQARIWTSGVPSWERLARLGLWIEGCAESMGSLYLLETVKEAVLQLPVFSKWTTLTHDGAGATGDGSRVLATYRIESHYPERAKEELSAAR
jgi:hydroxymethylbilane synthase